MYVLRTSRVARASATLAAAPGHCQSHRATAEVNALEARTEGWIAGLQLAALDRPGFIAALCGSHRSIPDYLVDEVIVRQRERVASSFSSNIMLPFFALYKREKR
jgi:hypothetical protein